LLAAFHVSARSFKGGSKMLARSGVCSHECTEKGIWCCSSMTPIRPGPTPHAPHRFLISYRRASAAVQCFPAGNGGANRVALICFDWSHNPTLPCDRRIWTSSMFKIDLLYNLYCARQNSWFVEGRKILPQREACQWPSFSNPTMSNVHCLLRDSGAVGPSRESMLS
jgi:hypothetical protein